jgi:predicted dinucleotide-binding enzyme
VVIDALKALAEQLSGKTLVDISNALDFSGGDIKIFTANGPSLGEQIQAALPKTNVVKAFNTMNASVQIDPNSLANGQHDLYIAGDDDRAKAQVTELAKSYGWKNIIDLGGIKSARGMETLMPFWLDMRKQLGHTNFNYKIVT